MTRPKVVTGTTRDVPARLPKHVRATPARRGARPTAEDLAVLAREERVADLMLARVPQAKIAIEVGYADHSGVAEAWERWLARNYPTLDPAWVDRRRKLQTAQVDRIMLDLWADRRRRVADGVDEAGKPKYRTEIDVAIVDRITRVWDRDAKLNGLDAADVRDDRRLELLAEQAESIARALIRVDVKRGLSEALREEGQRLLAEEFRIIEGESIRISDRAG